MVSAIKERGMVSYIILSVLTLGIYHIVFWTKLSKDVNALCEGDGKKTMKYVFCWLLNIVTVGIFGFVWKYKLAKRLQDNAARYDLRISESGALVVVLAIVFAFFPVAQAVLIKNFNALARAYNDYNGLEVKNESIFADEVEA